MRRIPVLLEKRENVFKVFLHQACVNEEKFINSVFEKQNLIFIHWPQHLGDCSCFQLCSSVRLCSLRVFEYCTNILASDICENTVFLIINSTMG